MKKSEVFRWAMLAVVDSKDISAEDKLEVLDALRGELAYANYVDAQHEDNEERNDG